MEFRLRGLARRLSRPFPWVVSFAVLLIVLVPLGRIATLTVLGAVCEFLGILILAGWLAIPWEALRRILHGWVDLATEFTIGARGRARGRVAPQGVQEEINQLRRDLVDLRQALEEGDRNLVDRLDALERRIPEIVRRETRAPWDGMILLGLGLVFLSAASLLSAAG